VPALEPYIIEPIWQQFEALLPERDVHHPLGCHKPRIPDRIIFEKLVQVMVFGCAYRRIAEEGCSATALRERREEWIEFGLMERLRKICLEAYERIIGLELSEVAVDCCVTKAPRGGEKAGRSPVDRGKRGIKRSMAVDARGIPLGAVMAPPTATTRRFWSRPSRRRPRRSAPCPRGAERPPRPRLRLASEPRASSGAGARVGDLGEGQAGPLLGHVPVGGGADGRVAQRPQQARVVHGKGGASDRFLGGVLGCGDHREAAHPRRLDALPVGRPTRPPTVTYPRRL
jgi:transposase